MNKICYKCLKTGTYETMIEDYEEVCEYHGYDIMIKEKSNG